MSFSIEFFLRLIGVLIFTPLFTQLGQRIAEYSDFPPNQILTVFSIFGFLTGLILTPWISIWPARALRRNIYEMPIDKLIVTLSGGFIGLLLGMMASYPLSILEYPWGMLLPAATTLLFVYLGMTIFNARAREIILLVVSRFGRSETITRRNIIIDTSVLIDGRLADIAETGFIGGTMIISRFVLNELHHIADSSDAMRRERGRRGLDTLNQLQQSDVSTVQIIDTDFDELNEVDQKLIALSKAMNGLLMTIDYNLSQVASVENVPVLNINQLANAVRSVYVPGEAFDLKIIQQGKDYHQGVGYLEDGTMVVVENARQYIDQEIRVTVTKLINRDTGRLIFARPEPA